MFAIKDLESVKNLSSIMTIPFFSAACLVDKLFNIFQDPITSYLLALHFLPTTIIAWLGVFLIVTFVVTFLLAGVDYCIVWLHAKFEYTMAIFGFAFLTAGLFVLSFAIPELPKAPLNPFWYLGLLCYGFSLFSRGKD